MYRARLDLGFDSIDMSAATMRKLTVAALVAYPVGALLRVQFGADHFLGVAVGNLLTLSALVIGFMVYGTRFYQIVEADDARLDEYQRSLRRATIADAYIVLSSLALVLLCYLYFALEFGLWLPASSEAWQKFAVGLGLLIMVLPTAMLVWSGKVDDHDDDTVAGEA
jgi:hypothetical protein